MKKKILGIEELKYLIQLIKKKFTNYVEKVSKTQGRHRLYGVKANSTETSTFDASSTPVGGAIPIYRADGTLEVATPTDSSSPKSAVNVEYVKEKLDYTTEVVEVDVTELLEKQDIEKFLELTHRFLDDQIIIVAKMGYIAYIVSNVMRNPVQGLMIWHVVSCENSTIHDDGTMDNSSICLMTIEYDLDNNKLSAGIAAGGLYKLPSIGDSANHGKVLGITENGYEAINLPNGTILVDIDKMLSEQDGTLFTELSKKAMSGECLLVAKLGNGICKVDTIRASNEQAGMYEWRVIQPSDVYDASDNVHLIINYYYVTWTGDQFYTETENYYSQNYVKFTDRDSFIKGGVTENTETLTDEEKTSACDWLGAIPKWKPNGAGYTTLCALNANGTLTSYKLLFGNTGNTAIPAYCWRSEGVYVLATDTPYKPKDCANKDYVDNLPDYLTFTDEQKAKWAEFLGFKKSYLHEIKLKLVFENQFTGDYDYITCDFTIKSIANYPLFGFMDDYKYGKLGHLYNNGEQNAFNGLTIDYEGENSDGESSTISHVIVGMSDDGLLLFATEFESGKVVVFDVAEVIEDNVMEIN